MPTYVYRCEKCGEFEVFQKITDNVYTKCPKCKGTKIKRKISGGVGVIFKGSGWTKKNI